MSDHKTVQEAIHLLQQLIETPSFSREESQTAELIYHYLNQSGIQTERFGNNILSRNEFFDDKLPTILLNSHHDTVKPNAGYTKDPFTALVEKDKLFGLGSNDAGGALVCLMMVYKQFYYQKLPFNLCFVASAEEEISGKNGIASVISDLPAISLAIVGEPTEMNLAIAEKGLVVLDCVMHGKAGHAARKNGENAIEMVLPDLQWLKDYEFKKTSETLGNVNLSVTQINAGSQHNVIPDRCEFVVDVRTTDVYSNEEVVSIIQESLKAEVTPRSTRLQPSGIPLDHPIIQAANELDIKTFGSPTMSDQALMPFPSVKIGPGKSERSHTADEFIYLNEIEEGISIYKKLLNTLKMS